MTLENLFNNKNLFEEAITHKSYAFENASNKTHNEKLEFLGDAVLDLVLSEFLMKHFPSDDEGRLSKKRASLVNESVLSQVAESIQLQSYMKLGKGELQTGGNNKPRLLASCYEALIGGLFLDSNYENVYKLVTQHFSSLVTEMNPDEDFSADFKTKLQELVQATSKTPPQYELIASSGPSHERTFQVAVKVNENILCTGEGRSKKQAEQVAAQKAIELLKEKSLS